MSKKLTKHGNSLALVIDKPILNILKIDEKTALELVVDKGELIIRPIRKVPYKSKLTQDKEVDEIARRIIEKYEDVFKKLAKT